MKNRNHAVVHGGKLDCVWIYFVWREWWEIDQETKCFFLSHQYERKRMNNKHYIGWLCRFLLVRIRRWLSEKVVFVCYRRWKRKGRNENMVRVCMTMTWRKIRLGRPCEVCRFYFGEGERKQYEDEIG